MTSVADAPRGNWVDRHAPEPLKPWLRLARADRPIGVWLLLWPCWWSSMLAAIEKGSALPNLAHLALFAVGAFVMRGAGCVWNDIQDRDLDAAVERTRSRPLPSGAVSTKGALAVAVGLSLVGFLVLIQFNRFAIVTGIASLAVVAVYPLMKRITSWPQAVLGLAFSWGALMGWAAAFGQLGWPPLLLFAGTAFWVMGYDTIYASQDKDDDAIIGIGSTALLFGAYARPMVALFYAICVALFALALAGVDAGVFAFIGLALFAAHLVRQVLLYDTDDAPRCRALFLSNREAGGVFFIGLLAESLWRGLV